MLQFLTVSCYVSSLEIHNDNHISPFENIKNLIERYKKFTNEFSKQASDIPDTMIINKNFMNALINALEVFITNAEVYLKNMNVVVVDEKYKIDNALTLQMSLLTLAQENNELHEIDKDLIKDLIFYLNCGNIPFADCVQYHMLLHLLKIYNIDKEIKDEQISEYYVKFLSNLQTIIIIKRNNTHQKLGKKYAQRETKPKRITNRRNAID
ncbi:hypothetical protein BDAP_000483 [Binucleata daphniae]